jgi:hypothetical protein
MLAWQKFETEKPESTGQKEKISRELLCCSDKAYKGNCPLMSEGKPKKRPKNKRQSFFPEMLLKSR